MRFVVAVGLEGELRLRIDDEPLLVRQRQLLVDLARDEDLLLGVVQVVAHEHAGVLLAEVTSGERLEREEEREAHLPALGDPAEAAAVLEEPELVGIKHDGFVVVGQ